MKTAGDLSPAHPDARGRIKELGVPVIGKVAGSTAAEAGEGHGSGVGSRS